MIKLVQLKYGTETDLNSCAVWIGRNWPVTVQEWSLASGPEWPIPTCDLQPPKRLAPKDKQECH